MNGSTENGELRRAEDLINAYSGRSEGELMRELAELTAGSDPSALRQQADMLRPFLTPEQAAKLDSILSAIAQS